MCGGGKSARRAADAAAAEQARQAEIERARLAEEARVARAEAEARYAEQVAREEARVAAERANAEALRKQIADQEAFRLSEMERIENLRRQDRETDLARQTRERNEDIARQTTQREADLARQVQERDANLARQAQERAAAEAAARDRTTQLGTYNANRQTVIDNARKQIEGAFGGYDDNFFGQYAQDYVNAMKPQIARQYDDAKRETTFGFARRGNLESTAAARSFGRLDETRAGAEADIAQQAQSNAAQFRNNVEGQRSQLLNSVFNASSAAPVITADNVGEANDSLNYLSSALSAPISLAGNTRISAPAFGQIGSIFKTQPGQAASQRSTFVPGAAAGGTGGGSSGRLVN